MIRTAFVLGAGLGTRLRPLTDLLPKPLIPIFHKPLITFAFDGLLAAGVERLIVNTHHLPERFDEAFPDYRHGRREILFEHERVLLETGGGIKNIEALAGGETLLVQSGDVLTDLPLAPLFAAHRQSGRLVTLALRSSGGPQPIAFDPRSGNVLDINQRVGVRTDARDYLFANISLMEPEVFAHIPEQQKISIATTWIDLVRDQPGSVGGVLIDEGHWWNIGSAHDYLEVHRYFAQPEFELQLPREKGWPQKIHPSARCAGVSLQGMVAMGADVEIPRGSELSDVIVWPGCRPARPVHLRNGILTPDGFVRAEGEGGCEGS